MENQGTIGTAVTLPIDLWNEMESLRNDIEVGRSRFVQSALRNHIKRVKNRIISEYLDDLNPKEIELLKEEMKKRSL